MESASRPGGVGHGELQLNSRVPERPRWGEAGERGVRHAVPGAASFVVSHTSCFLFRLGETTRGSLRENCTSAPGSAGNSGEAAKGSKEPGAPPVGRAPLLRQELAERQRHRVPLQRENEGAKRKDQGIAQVHKEDADIAWAKS